MKVQVGPVEVELLDGDRISHHVATTGQWEPESLAAWAGMCRDGGTVIDAGAYVGVYAISAALLGCEVFAFEPLPTNAARLRQNAALNAVSVAVIEAALGDKVGKATLQYNGRIPFTSGGSLVGRRQGAQITIAVTRIDGISFDDVTAIKIDVEGGEVGVLRGAVETLDTFKPRLLIEALTATARREIETALPAYRVARVLDGRNLLMEPA